MSGGGSPQVNSRGPQSSIPPWGGGQTPLGPAPMNHPQFPQQGPNIGGPNATGNPTPPVGPLTPVNYPGPQTGPLTPPTGPLTPVNPGGGYQAGPQQGQGGGYGAGQFGQLQFPQWRGGFNMPSFGNMGIGGMGGLGK